MSIMSGLVETGTEAAIAPRQTALGEWMVRHAWSLILGGSLTFWLVLGGTLVLR